MTRTDSLVAAYAADYMEKVFYFCLKKTGSPTEAEDLASEITLAVLTALQKGTVPEHFSAWVWQIARNQYSKWAEAKHKKAARISPEDIGVIEVAKGTLEEEWQQQEDLKLLRRELAFIGNDYRQILLAYYLEDRPVRDIAQSLSVPEGTVTSKLFRSRQSLKEGIQMAREFGVRSYRPEEVNFASSGNQPGPLPFSAVSRKIPKNILLQADNNPSTAEELAMELGIALPYMEEEIRLLKDATLLKEVGGKYVTDFFIENRECQQVVYEAQRKGSKERSRLIGRIVTDSLPALREMGVAGEGVKDGEFQWMLIPRLTDLTVQRNPSYQIHGLFRRPDGGDWGFMGFEEWSPPENLYMNHGGNGIGGLLMAYQCDVFKGRNPTPDGQIVPLLADVVKNRRTVSSLTALEKDMLSRIPAGYFKTDDNGYLLPAFPVFTAAARKATAELCLAHPDYATLQEMTDRLFEEVKTILKKYSHPVLRDQWDYCATMLMFSIRKMTVNDLMEAGVLTLPEDPASSPAGVYLELE